MRGRRGGGGMRRVQWRGILRGWVLHLGNSSSSSSNSSNNSDVNRESSRSRVSVRVMMERERRMGGV